jgi:hypothetical protein
LACVVLYCILTADMHYLHPMIMQCNVFAGMAVMDCTLSDSELATVQVGKSRLFVFILYLPPPDIFVSRLHILSSVLLVFLLCCLT